MKWVFRQDRQVCLQKKQKNFKVELLSQKSGKIAEAIKLMVVMGLGVKYGDTVTIEVSSTDEDEATENFHDFFAANL